MKLGVLDITVLFAYLAATVAIGSMFFRRKSSSEEFLFAGRSAAWIPVAISILATDFSAISYLGIPAFVYQRDLQVAPFVFVLAIIVIPIVRRWFVPFYNKLGLSTAYEYLEKRFDLRVRLMASAIFLVMRGLYMGIVIYAPSLVIAVVTGLPLKESILLMGVLTTIYTALGGMKAVIWTDFMQFFVIVLGLGGILGVAASRIEGGWAGIFSTTAALGKTKIFDYSLDPTKEFTFWAMIIGATFMFLNTYGTDQVIIQRYMTTRNVDECKRALKLEAFLLIPVLMSLQVTGLALAAYYHYHPAEAAGLALKDAVLPYFAVNNLPAGISGLVIASIFAAAMSTVSGGINSLTTATIVDFRRRLSRKKDEAGEMRAARWLTVAWGVAATLLALVADRLGELANSYNRVNTLLGGVMLGIFLTGMLTRRVRGTAVLVGAVLGFAIVALVARAGVVSWLWHGAIGCSSTFLISSLLARFDKGGQPDLAVPTLR